LLHSSAERVAAPEAQELWAAKLRTVPSVFARIVYMSRLCGRTRRYFESELASISSRAICHQVVQHAHLASFRMWLTLGLRAKIADLRPYLASLGFRGSPVRDSAVWIELARSVVPDTASDNERDVFVATLDTVIRLLNELDAR
jgi:hypothetical protein